MKVLKNNLKVILVFIIGVLLASSVSLYAYSYIANDIKYIKKDGTEISVADALNDLYNEQKNKTIRKNGTFNTDYSMSENDQSTILYTNTNGKTATMVYYTQTSQRSGEYACAWLEYSTNGGTSWNQVFLRYDVNCTEYGKIDLPSNSIVRIHTQKNACFNFYEIYITEN